MRTFCQAAVFVIVPFCLMTMTYAFDEPVDLTDSKATTPAQSVSATTTGTAAAYPPDSPGHGFDQFRQIPGWGIPGTPTFGTRHFDGPLRSYTTWYTPRAHELTKGQRCQPDEFRPRGFGHLFARDPYGRRMDYAPYVLRDPTTTFGPAYYTGQGDPRCEKQCCDGNCFGDDCEECDECRGMNGGVVYGGSGQNCIRCQDPNCPCHHRQCAQ